MSLVSDALKKAQREAAAREAREKGLPEQLMSAGQPFRARRRGSGGMVALAATVALLTGGTVAWFLLARPPAGPEGESANLPAPPPAADRALASSPTAEAPLKEAGADATAVAAPSPASEDPAPAPAPLGAGGTAATATAPGTLPSSESGGRAAEATSVGAAPAPAPSAPEAQPGLRRFVREARLEDGVEIRLGGIAWSDVAPLAYLNGRLLGVGESVSGWTIERIERDGVRLSGAGGSIRIALR